MSKRFLDNKSMDQEYEERRQFIRQNAPSMELKPLAKRFFAKFDLQSKSAAYDALLSSLNSTGCEQQANEVKICIKDKAASKLSLLTAIKRRRTQLEVSGVIKGHHMIQSGMNRLVEEANSPCSTDDDSQGGKSSGSVSPSVAYQERREVRAGSSIGEERRGMEPIGTPVVMPTSVPSEKVQEEFPDPTLRLEHFATLGQAIVWNVDGTDMVQKFHGFRTENQGPFSLAHDGIADLTHDSLFCQMLDPTVLSTVRRAEPAPNIYERWPTLRPICNCVFASNNYDEVARAVRSENMRDPIAAYLFVIVMA
ncbi:hypothetical protein BGZ81_003650 [Podila clonocystis]|nr:hypothetical protein BGZ81_003650 [Podila clonocystis]